MWLPLATLSHEEQLGEFDQWVTPSLGDIRDTDRYRAELDGLHEVLVQLASRPRSETVSDSLVRIIAEVMDVAPTDHARSAVKLNAIIAAIYLVTAKSDNAVKCQYPIVYRSRHGDSFPGVRARRLIQNHVPSVLKSVDIVRSGMKLTTVSSDAAADLVIDYVGFLLENDKDVEQLEALTNSVGALEETLPGASRDLLAPLVSFQVRGSVAASGGHDPEAIVRRHLRSWGLKAGEHFNTTDITATAVSNWLVAQGDDLNGARIHQPPTGDKTRAFDFVIPNLLENASERVFIQSQFYAGDSGSVSHKNVDQAGKARAHAAQLFPDACFVELVDGAGYCGSLRRDLQHLIFAADTADFVQVRSIPVRLRRVLQRSGILIPLDIAVRVAEGVSTVDDLIRDLPPQFSRFDLASFVSELRGSDWLTGNDDALEVHPSKSELTDDYALLDDIARRGQRVTSGHRVLIPGFGPDYGALFDSSWDASALERLSREKLIIILESP